MPPRFGLLAVVRDKGARFAVQADRLAIDEDGTVYYVSIVAPARLVKAFGAALNGKASVHFEPEGLDIKGGRTGAVVPHYVPRWLRPAASRYRSHHHRLGYDWSHAAWVAKDPRFLPCVEPESLYRALKRPEFTTPLLREWMDHVAERLVADRALTYLLGHDCRCGLLTAKTADLDRVVSGGLAAGALQIDGPDDFGIAAQVAAARSRRRRRRAV